jgi:hypothetical protein
VPAILQGTLAQLVEQRTDNPCVPGSIPGGTTKTPLLLRRGFFMLKINILNVNLLLHWKFFKPLTRHYICASNYSFIN